MSGAGSLLARFDQPTNGRHACKLTIDTCKHFTYIAGVIRSVRSKPLKLFATKGDASKLPVSGVAIDRIEAQLTALDTATAADQMDVPGWYFHSLKGKPLRYSVRVTANYRLTFAFDPPDADDVDLEDYH